MNTFEFKVIELNIPGDLLATALDPKIREKINPIIEETLNTYGKDGWRLHMSGLTAMPTIILERQSATRTDKTSISRTSKTRKFPLQRNSRTRN